MKVDHLPKTNLCQVCHKYYSSEQLYPAELVSVKLTDLIKQTIPGWDEKGYICINDLHKFRSEYIHHLIEEGPGEMDKLHQDVLKTLAENELLSKNVNTEFDEKLSFGEKLSDRIAEFGGSWKFIILFGVIMAFWISLNTIALIKKPFDPFPYILLNLVLSCLAAMQAPVIMMSQNRQESKDRLRSEHDYKVNLKAELEIRNLNDKIDFLLMKQWQRLIEIQSFQNEMMEEILEKKVNKQDRDKGK